MSWIQKLYETYENCSAMIGPSKGENVIPLVPICHTTQKAQIEIVIDKDGNFKRARIVPKADARTIIPCTEQSGGRTSGEAPHPLCDKLQYVAQDYKKFGGAKAQYSNSYLKQLAAWCISKNAHTKVQAVYNYVRNGNVISDLVSQQILMIDSNDKLIESWKGKEPPEIFRVLSGTTQQSDCFVRWSVEVPNDPQSEVWNDSTIFDSWIAYYSTLKENRDLCYVSGNMEFIADQHPAKIRNDGDKAKLISSNDASGFTYRGRFTSASQACGVGFVVTQKAHNALRWLIGKQGYRRGSQAIVAWATQGRDIPNPLADAYSILGFEAIVDDSAQVEEVSTAEDLALRLRNKLAGYHAILGNSDEIVVIALDSATPGRMALSFYRELTGADFLQRIEYWHETCCWKHNYRVTEIMDTKTKKRKRVHPVFVGAPTPGDIAEVTYGQGVDDKLRKSTIERLLPCIIDGRKIPRDLVELATNRASNRVGMDEWEWNKTLSIACALFRKYAKDYKGVNYSMALEETRRTRDYLYGRLLAIADSIEQWALREAGENRQTAAARLMQRFADHPYTTWRTLELSLTPYKARLGGKLKNRLNLLAEVMAMFEYDDFLNDKKLNGEFLLGYHCQRDDLRKRSKPNDINDETVNDEAKA